MKIELGYNAGISVYNNYKNETTLEIEDNKLLPNVLLLQKKYTVSCYQKTEDEISNTKDDYWVIILECADP